MSSDPQTIRVRVKVLVNAEGQWAAYGYDSAGPDDEDEVLYDMMSSQDIDTDSARSYWLTADIPIPQPVEVAASVEEASDAS